MKSAGAFFVVSGFAAGIRGRPILIFLLIILAYTVWMNRLDKAYGVEEEGQKVGRDAS
ncbi:MAG: hypothetical protein F7O42_07645 [Opitutae bacterium]|nr:hypothetical protein [Opitutae bacterium]